MTQANCDVWLTAAWCRQSAEASDAVQEGFKKKLRQKTVKRKNESKHPCWASEIIKNNNPKLDSRTTALVHPPQNKPKQHHSYNEYALFSFYKNKQNKNITV